MSGARPWLPERLVADDEYVVEAPSGVGAYRAACRGHGTTGAEDAAFAAEIVRRWNAYSDLVAALREAERCIEAGDPRYRAAQILGWTRSVLARLDGEGAER